jgi:GTPase
MSKARDRVFLIGVFWGDENKDHFTESFEELQLLAKTANVEVIETFSQQLKKPNTATYIGKGKLKEIAAKAKSQKVRTLIFNNNLSPSQSRNISDTSRCNVVDRTELILDIFANHAQTKQAKLQVELAQLEYALTKLKRLWKHLSRIQGGIGFRGPGETQIEVDRREIRKKSQILKKRLKEIENTSKTKRKKRKEFISIALVGYTNAGKSTLFNKLTKENRYTADQLFATLDSTTRSLILKDGEKVVITDTIGFIRKLPHKLIESFHSTLTEVIEADLLLHVVDVSHPNVLELMESVNEVLQELKVDDKNILVVFNKSDLTAGNHFKFVKKLLMTEYPDNVLISAKTESGFDTLFERISEFIRRKDNEIIFYIPLELTNLIEFIHNNGVVLEESISYGGNDLKMNVRINRQFIPNINKQIDDFKLLKYIES